jgi:hypothetical protein
MRDVPRREPARGDLVEERLKQMEVPTIDENDLEAGITERLGSIETAESTPDDHHAFHVRYALASFIA